MDPQTTAQGESLPRRERMRLQQRGEMFDAALGLFAEKGYHNVSMHEIARKGEFAIGTVYKFFRNKEHLYRSLLISKAEELSRLLKGVLDQKGDPLGVIKAYAQAKGAYFADNLDVVRLYFAETRGASYNLKAGLDQEIRALYDEVVDNLTTIFRAGIRKKIFRRLDPYFMAMALDGLTNTFLFCWLDDPEAYPYQENIPVMSEMFFQGVVRR